MKTLLSQFKKEAESLGRDKNSVNELKLWVEAIDKTSDEEFVTIVDAKNVDMYGRKKGMDYAFIQSCKVHWTLNQDYRSYGIKDIYPSINKIEVEGVWSIDQEDELELQEPFELIITDTDWKIAVDYSRAKFANGLFPTGVDIKFDEQNAEVEF